MSRRSVVKQSLIDELEYDIGLDRELKRVSKDLWKIKQAKKDKKRRKK